MAMKSNEGQASTIVEAQFTGPEGEDRKAWLEGEQIRLSADPLLGGEAVGNALKALGIDGEAEIRARPRIKEPLEGYDPASAQAYGATMSVEIEIAIGGETVAQALSPILVRTDQTPLLCPWAINLHGNIFADTGPAEYCVRTQLVDEPGVYFDEYRATEAQTEQTMSGYTREAGVLATSDTREPRLTFIVNAPDEADGARDFETMRELTLQIWPAARPFGEPARPYTIRGNANIEKEVTRVAARAKGGRSIPRDRAFRITPRVAADLQQLHANTFGVGEDKKRAKTPTLSVEDLKLIANRLGDPEPIDESLGVRSLTRMRATTAIDTLRSTLRRGISEGIAEALGTNNPSLDLGPMIGPRAQTAEAVVQALAEAFGATAIRAHLERALTGWRRTSRTTRIDREMSAAAVTTASRTMITRPHRLSHGTDDLSVASDLRAPHMGALFLDILSVSHNAQPGRTMTVLHGARLLGEGFRRLPALVVTEIETGEERVVTLRELAGKGILLGRPGEELSTDNVVIDGRPAPHAPAQFLIPDAGRTLSGYITGRLVLNGYTSATRKAMAASMATAAIGDGVDRPTAIAPEHTDEEIEATPTQRMRVAYTNGNPLLFEDAVLISHSAARRHIIEPRQTLSYQRYAGDDANWEYAGGIGARYEDAAHDLPWLSREAYDKLEESGLVRVGQTIEPGDIIQLRRKRDPEQGTWRYSADKAPAHGRHKVSEVLHEAVDTAIGYDAIDEHDMTIAQIGDTGADDTNAQGLESVQVRLVERTTLDSTCKFTLTDGTKGVAHVVADAKMPHDEQGRPFDIAVNDRSVAGRKAPSAMVQGQLGHLLVTRTKQLHEALEEVGRGNAGAWTEQCAQIAQTLHIALGQDRTETMKEHLGLDDGAPTPEQARDAAQRLEAAGLDALNGSTVCLVLPPSVGPERLDPMVEALGYRDDEERTVCYANRADYDARRKLASPGSGGVVDLWVLKHLGRKSATYRPIDDDSASVDPSTGQRRDTRRHGRMESDSMLAGGGTSPNANLMAYGDEAARQKAIESIRQGNVPTIPDPEDDRADSTRRHYLACAGLLHGANGELRPMADYERRALALSTLSEQALGPTHDANGKAIQGGVADAPAGGPWRFSIVELAEPVMNPLALMERPGGQRPMVLVALDMSAAELRETLLQRDGAAQIKERLDTIDRLIETNLPAARDWARQREPDAARESIEVFEALAGHPGYKLSDWVMECVALSDPRLRGYLRGEAAVGAGDASEHFARNLIEGSRQMNRGDRSQAKRRALGRDARGMIENAMIGRTAGKYNVAARAMEGRRVAVSASGPTLPAHPRECPPHAASVPVEAARALSGHWAKSALVHNLGWKESRAQKAMDRINAQTLNNGDADVALAFTTLKRAAALHPAIMIRSPALHMHSAWAVELLVRDPRENSGVDLDGDSSIKLHPMHCEGMNADYDGDQVGLSMNLRPDAAEEARRTLGAHAQLWASDGNGLYGLPRHDSAEGLIFMLNHLSATPMDGMRQIANADELAREILDRALATGIDAERWNGTGAPVDMKCVERLIEQFQRNPAGIAGVATDMVSMLWDTGFESMKDNPHAHASLGSYKKLATIYKAARHAGLIEGVEPMAAEGVKPKDSKATRRQFKHDSAERIANVSRWFNRMGKNTDEFEALAQNLGLEEMAEGAKAGLAIAQGGGRMKPFALAQICGERGGPSHLDGETHGWYDDSGTVDGTRPGYALGQAVVGGEMKVAVQSQVAIAGHFSQLLGNASGGRSSMVEAEDCGGPTLTARLATGVLTNENGEPDRTNIARWSSTRYAGRETITCGERTITPGDILDRETLVALANTPARFIEVDLTLEISTDRLMREDKRNELTGATCLREVKAGTMKFPAGTVLGQYELEVLSHCSPPQPLLIDPSPLEPATQAIEGAELARAATLAGGERLERGHVLSPSDITRLQSEKISIAIREPGTCKLADGVCAHCVGTLKSTGRRPDVGTMVGELAATALSHKIVQSDLSQFHGEGIELPGQDGRRATSEAFLTALDNARNRVTQPGAFNPADPHRGALADEATAAWDEGGPVRRRRTIDTGICAIDPNANWVDPTLRRIVAGALAGNDGTKRDTVDLNRTAGERNPGRYLATGRKSRLAARVAGEAGITITDMAREAARAEQAREKSPNWRLDPHRAAAKDDIEALLAMSASDPQILHAVDAQGWTAMRYAHSEGAVQVLIEAGISPNEGSKKTNAQDGGITAIELMTVRPMAPKAGRKASDERRGALRAMLAVIPGPKARSLVHNDPLLAGALNERTPVEMSAER